MRWEQRLAYDSQIAAEASLERLAHDGRIATQSANRVDVARVTEATCATTTDHIWALQDGWKLQTRIPNPMPKQPVDIMTGTVTARPIQYHR